MVCLLSEREQNEAIQAFINLGLTSSQAKVYTTLAKSGTSTGRTTAKLAQVASQDVYRILTELQEKGLIEKIIAKPAMYRAITFKEGLSILLQIKKEEYFKLEQQAKIISDNSFENINQEISQEKLHLFLVSEIKHIRNIHEKLVYMTKKSVDIIVPLKMTQKNVFYNWPYLKKAIRRGVIIRIIVQKANTDSSLRNPKPSSKNFSFELRYLPEVAIPFGMYIFDKQEVTFSLSEKPIPGLRTDNPTVIALAKAYFENMWPSAQTN